MQAYLEGFFKNTPLSINSVLKAAVGLAEMVNSRTELSGKDKSDLVVSTLVDFFGEGQPEMVALVTGVVPGMLGIVVSAARGKLALNQVVAVAEANASAVKGWCASTAAKAKTTPSLWSWAGLCSKASAAADAPVAVAAPAAAAPVAAPAAPAVADPAAPAVAPATDPVAVPAEKVTLREASA